MVASRRALALVAVATVAACDPPGLTIEIVVPSGVKTVEMFVGRGCSGECPDAIAAPQLGAMRIERTFMSVDESPWQATPDDGVAGFRLTADQAGDVPFVLVLGLDGNDVPIGSAQAYGVHVPHATAELVRVTLEPLEPAVAPLSEPTPPPQGTERAALWREPQAKRACVVLEHWNGTSEPKREMVVPATDPDCDSVENECAPWTYLATGLPPGIDDASCVVHDALPNGTAFCTLGGPPCDETIAPGAGCHPLDVPYCTTERLCNRCPTWSTSCADDAIKTGALDGMPHLSCVFGVGDLGEPCSDEVTVSGIDGRGLLGSTTAAMCTDAGVHDLEVPLGPFAGQVDLTAGQFIVDKIDPACSLSIRFRGVPLTSARTDAFLVDVTLDTGRHIALPATIDVVQSCTGVGTCTIDTGGGLDSMFQCIDATPPMPGTSCAPTNTCPNGPTCGGICCAVGETCDNGTCSCGGGGPCKDGNTCQRPGAPDPGCGTICCGATTLCPQ